MYYEIRENDILILTHDVTIKSLPKDGWIHNCIFCNTITSLEVDFPYFSKYKIKVIICKDCKYFNEIEKNKDKIILWIKNNIIQ